MKKQLSLLVLLTAILIPAGARTQAQEPLDGPKKILQDDLLEHMAGNWRLTGPVARESADHQVAVDWIMNHQFLRVHETAVVPSKSGMKYEAMFIIGYDNTSERYVVHLIDVFGGRWSETLGYGRRDGNAIEFVFEYPDGPFHTTFRWEPESRTWRWHMRQKTAAGVWADFANFTLTPEAPPSGKHPAAQPGTDQGQNGGANEN